MYENSECYEFRASWQMLVIATGSSAVPSLNASKPIIQYNTSGMCFLEPFISISCHLKYRWYFIHFAPYIGTYFINNGDFYFRYSMVLQIW